VSTDGITVNYKKDTHVQGAGCGIFQHAIFRLFRKIAKKKATISFVTSFRPPVHI